MTSSLVDSFGRAITYLRISVTDRCNLRCTYCMAEDMTFLPRQSILSLEEIEQIARGFVSLGVDKIRLTGGEPLVRRGIIQLADNLAQLDGLRELVMTTNGLLLKDQAKALVEAGVRRINISLDSLNADTFAHMTRVGKLSDVLTGIEAAQRAGFERIKLNVVVLQGQNDAEIVDLARFALNGGMDISFIEEMPLGRIDSHRRDASQYQSLSVRERLQQQFELLPSIASTGGPSRYFSVKGYVNRIGFISPISDNFCASCNRVRLTPEGKLLLCLGNEHARDLKALIRRHPDHPEVLRTAILNAIQHKPERHYFDPQDTQILRFMNATGG